MCGKKVKYWGKLLLQYIGISLASAMGLMILFGGGNVALTGNGREILQTVCVLYPAYVILVSIFLMVVGTISQFQSYVPVLLSLNATRRGVTAGIFLSTGGLVLAIAAVAGLFWLSPASEMENVAEGMAVTAGALLMFGAFGMFMGAVAARWGRKGIIVTTIVAALMGGIFGAGVALLGHQTVAEIQHFLMDRNTAWILVSGIVLYVLAGGAAMLALRKLEVRA